MRSFSYGKVCKAAHLQKRVRREVFRAAIVQSLEERTNYRILLRRQRKNLKKESNISLRRPRYVEVVNCSSSMLETREERQ